MKVARYRALGGPENIESAEQPDAVAREGELLVKVHATSVNPVDWKMATGVFPFNILKPSLPYVPGFDVAGEVLTAAGDFKKGDRVFTRLPGMKGGASAELVAVEPKYVVKIPEGMSSNEAAGVPLAALTALQGLRNEARMSLTAAEGYRVLVVGASGGVGHYGIQLARAAGAHVTGVCSGKNAEIVAALGADAVIDYTKTEKLNPDGDYDVILDCVGGASSGRFTPMLTKRGVYVSTFPDAGIFARQIGYALLLQRRVRGVMMQPSADDLRHVAGLVTAGKFRTHIDEVFPLARLGDAHRKSATGRARGKLIVSVTG